MHDLVVVEVVESVTTRPPRYQYGPVGQDGGIVLAAWRIHTRRCGPLWRCRIEVNNLSIRQWRSAPSRNQHFPHVIHDATEIVAKGTIMRCVHLHPLLGIDVEQ